MTTAIPLAAAVVPDRVLHCSTRLRVDVFDLTSIVIVAVRGVVEAASVDLVIAAVQGAVLRPRPIVIDVSASAGWIDPALVAAARRTGGDVFLVPPGGKATVGRQEEMTGTDGDGVHRCADLAAGLAAAGACLAVQSSQPSRLAIFPAAVVSSDIAAVLHLPSAPEWDDPPVHHRGRHSRRAS